MKPTLSTARYTYGSLPIKPKRSTDFIALFDLHFPHTLFFDSILSMLADTQPDYLILGGDALNMDPFNHWAKNVPKQLKVMPSPKPYYNMVNREFFHPLREAVGKKTKIVYLLGNHEHWSHKAVDMIPELEGYAEIENNLETGVIDYLVDCKGMVALGDLWFSHGDNEFFSKNNHAKKVAQGLMRSVMFGHYHDYEIHSLKTPLDMKPIIGISTPCLTDTNPCSYGKNMPTNRSHGFGAGIVNPGGEFHAYVTQIKNGEWVFKDKWYKSKQVTTKEVGYSL